MSISTGLYPKLDLWTANKLHYSDYDRLWNIVSQCQQEIFLFSETSQIGAGTLSKLPIYWVLGLFAWGKVARALS